MACAAVGDYWTDSDAVVRASASDGELAASFGQKPAHPFAEGAGQENHEAGLAHQEDGMNMTTGGVCSNWAVEYAPSCDKPEMAREMVLIIRPATWGEVSSVDVDNDRSTVIFNSHKAATRYADELEKLARK